MEASALQAPTTLAEPRVAIGLPILRFRSDEQLVALFRAGNDDAFRAIHDRYRTRLFAYARQMLPGRQDAEDALQDVFVRAYAGLRSSSRDLALRAWLFRVAHNRCVDELRRPLPPAPEVLHLVRPSVQDPVAEADVRESLRRLIADIRRLPHQQRSALLMRELGGMSYADLAASLDVSVPAVKSLLVRARISLAQAADARDTACSAIREELVGAHDRGVRPNANARKHLHDCVGCKSFRRELRGVSRRLAALTPGIGPLGILAKVLGISGFSGGGATAGGATAGGGVAVAGGTGAIASAGGLVLGTSHVATLLVAAVATAGGAVEIQHTLTPAHHPAHHRAAARKHPAAQLPPGSIPFTPSLPAAEVASAEQVVAATVAKAPVAPHAPVANQKAKLRADTASSGGGAGIGPASSTQGSAASGSDAGGATVTPADGSSGTATYANSTGTCPATGTGTATTTTTGTGTGTGTSSSCSSTTGSGTSSGSSGTPTQSTNDPNSTSTSSGSPSSGGGSTSSSSGSTSTSSGTGSGSSTSGTSGSSSSTPPPSSGPSAPLK